MKRKLLELIILTLLVVLLYIPSVYATGASVSLNKNQAKPGETVELYFDLTTTAVEYDVVINANDKSLYSSAQLVSDISKGNAESFALYQDGNASKKQYSSGTRIATIKYTISNKAKAGSKLELTIEGDVLDARGLRSKFDEKLTIDIVDQPTVPDEPSRPSQPDQPSQPSQPSQPTQPDKPAEVPVKKPTQSEPIPKAGISPNFTLVIICVLAWCALISYANINKINKKAIRLLDK